MTTPSEEEARAAINDARAWLDSHQHHHSARRTDVRRLVAALEAALASRVSTPPSEDWEYGWRSFFANGEEYEWLACSSREEAEHQAREYQIEEDRQNHLGGNLTYSVWRRRVTTPGPWEPVPAVPVLPTEPECWCSDIAQSYGLTDPGCPRHDPAPTEPEEKR